MEKFKTETKLKQTNFKNWNETENEKSLYNWNGNWN